MPAPYDYTLNATDPTDEVLEGLKVAQYIKDVKQKRLLQVQAAERQSQMSAALGTLGPESTADDYIAIANLMPKEQGENLRKNWDLLNEEKQKNQLLASAQIMAAFDVDPKIGIQLLNERAKASRNSGDDDMAKAYETWTEIAKVNPDAARRAMGVMVAALPGGKETLESLAKYTEDLRKEELHPLGMKKLEADIAKIKAEAGEGELTSADKFTMEKKIRDEYTQRTKELADARMQYGKIQIAGADKSGVGDVSLIFAFMKMLDPGSVVRESEFAHAEKTGGLYTQLKMLYPKVTKGERLKDWQRAKFTNIAKQYLDAAEGHIEKVRVNLRKTIEEYGLTEENIFAPEEEKKTEAEPPGYMRHAKDGEYGS